MALTSQRGSELERLIPKHLKDIPRKCTRVQCGSEDVQMRYFNNHNLNQPRFVCNTCKVNFTLGGKSRQPYKTKKKNIVMKRSNLEVSKLKARCVETTISTSIGGATYSNFRKQPRTQRKRHASRHVRFPTLEGALDKSNSIDVENEEKVSKDVSIQALIEKTNLVEDDEGHFEEDEVDESDEDYFPDDEVDELVGQDDDPYVLEDEVDDPVEEDDDCYVLEDEVDEPFEVQDDDCYVQDDDCDVLEDEVDEPFEIQDDDCYVLEDEVDKHVEVQDDDRYVLEDEVDEHVEVQDNDRYVLEDEVDEHVEEDDEGYVREYEVDEPIEVQNDDCYVLEDEVDEPFEVQDDDCYVLEDEVDEPFEVDNELEINNLADVSEVKIQEHALQTKATKKSSMVISTNELTHDTLPKRKQVMKKATQYLIDALTTLEEVYLEKHAMMLHRKCCQVEQARERENRERSKYEETLHSLKNCSMKIVRSWVQYESLTTTRLDKMIACENELKIVSQEVEELYSQVKQIDIKYVCHSEVVKIETKANQLWNRVVELVE